MNDRDRIGEDLARSRQDLAEAIAAFGKGFDISRIFGGRAGRSGEDTGAGPSGAAVMPALRAAGEAAGATIRANPGAAALAGAGIAWLAWSGLRRRAAQRQKARPEWLVAIAALREDAARLRARIDRSHASGALTEDAARDSLEDVEASLDLAILQELGRGLDGLDSETRAAALATREAVLRREFGKSVLPRQGAATGGGFGRLLATGTVLTAAGGCLAAFLNRGQPEPDAPEKRDALREDLDQLTSLVARLAQTLGDVLDETVARAEPAASSRSAASDDRTKARDRV